MATSHSDPLSDPHPLYRGRGRFEAVESTALPPEIAFLAAEGFDPAMLGRAARRASELGVGADEVLLAEGLAGDRAYYAALAGRLNCSYVERAAGFDYWADLRSSVARADGFHEPFEFLMAPRGPQIRALLALGPEAAAPCPRTPVSRCRGQTPC